MGMGWFWRWLLGRCIDTYCARHFDTPFDRYRQISNAPWHRQSVEVPALVAQTVELVHMAGGASVEGYGGVEVTVGHGE
jgi:hypothetical protein